MYYSHACAEFVARESTEADTISDSEQEVSPDKGKDNEYVTIVH